MTDDDSPRPPIAGQTAIPTDPPANPGEGPCEWCGDLPTVPFLVEPARWGKGVNGVRVLKRRATVVPACHRHARAFGQSVGRDDA